MGRGMHFVPRIARLGLVSLAVAGLAEPVLAGQTAPGNGGSITLPSIILPSVLPPASVRDPLSLSSSNSSFDALGQKFVIQNGQMDFFSVRQDDGAFKPLLRGGVGDGGLQLQLKW